MHVLVYTLEGKFSTADLGSLGLKKDNSVFEGSLKKLIARWRLDVEKEKILGVSWEADRILHRFLFASGRYRLLIMRPYLEARDLFGVTRFLVKKILSTVISRYGLIEVARLSIPYAHKKSVRNRWVRDDFNTEIFFNSLDNAAVPDELKSITRDHHIISVLGYLDSRKNPLQAYRIFEQIRINGNQKTCLLFAGVQTDSFKLELSKIESKNNIIQIDRALTTGEYIGVIKASRLILLIYANHGASGIVLNSLSLGTPVFLRGGRHWRKLKRISDGSLHVGKRNFQKHVIELGNLQSLPHQSKIQILSQEPTLYLVSSFNSSHSQEQNMRSWTTLFRLCEIVKERS